MPPRDQAVQHLASLQRGLRPRRRASTRRSRTALKQEMRGSQHCRVACSALPYGQLRFAAGGRSAPTALTLPCRQLVDRRLHVLREPSTASSRRPSTAGSITVKEAYGELLVPVLADLPFAQGAQPRARLSPVGLQHDRHHARPTRSTANGAGSDWLRFRGGFQNASRAPNLGEVFTARTQTLVNGSDGDPCSRGNTVSPLRLRQLLRQSWRQRRPTRLRRQPGRSAVPADDGHGRRGARTIATVAIYPTKQGGRLRLLAVGGCQRPAGRDRARPTRSAASSVVAVGQRMADVACGCRSTTTASR